MKIKKYIISYNSTFCDFTVFHYKYLSDWKQSFLATGIALLFVIFK